MIASDAYRHTVRMDRESQTLSFNQRFSVRAPYFALTDLTFNGSRLQAYGPSELPRGNEQMPMAAGDIGRHSAIVGLCCAALAQRDDTRRYYLARQAEGRGYYLGPREGNVRFEGELERLDKRSAVSVVRATVEGQLLSELRVTYTILTAAAFERLFAERARVFPGVVAERYEGTVEGVLEVAGERRRLTVPEVPLRVCAGHFDGYPAMPVATLMSQLSQLAGGMMDAPYIVSQTTVAADDLLWAGAEAVFEVERIRQQGNEHVFRGSVTSQGVSKGKVEMVFTTVAAP